jgi:uncharacterized membrane protein
MFEHPLVDRFARSLFVALAVGLAWGIRGDFGGGDGAMYPGVILALAFAYVSGQESIIRRMPALALLGGWFIGMGGLMSYGVLHGYAKADTFTNYSYGFFTLLMQGGCWGIFGGAALGLAIDDRRPRLPEALGISVAVVALGIAVEKFVTHSIGFQVDPRGNSVITFSAGAVVLVAWLAARGYVYGLRGAFFGFLGFGLGMSFGRLLSNVAEHFPWEMNTWNVMEVSCGLIGGFIFTWGMVGLPDRAEEPRDGVSLSALTGIAYGAAFVPLWHLVSRVPPVESKVEWAAQLMDYGYPEPAASANQIYTMIALVACGGLVMAGLWLWWHREERSEFAWQPALGLSLIMVLFQNINALYFWYPARENFLNMHSVFWVLLALMVGYIALRRGHDAMHNDDEDSWWPVAAGWSAALLLVFIATLGIASKVNGEKTMRSAEMRWPQWSWRDGTPPPR